MRKEIWVEKTLEVVNFQTWIIPDIHPLVFVYKDLAFLNVSLMRVSSRVGDGVYEGLRTWCCTWVDVWTDVWTDVVYVWTDVVYMVRKTLEVEAASKDRQHGTRHLGVLVVVVVFRKKSGSFYF